MAQTQCYRIQVSRLRIHRQTDRQTDRLLYPVARLGLVIQYCMYITRMFASIKHIHKLVTTHNPCQLDSNFSVDLAHSQRFFTRINILVINMV